MISYYIKYITIKSNLCKSILLSWRENYISEEKSIILSISWFVDKRERDKDDKRLTLYNASWISWNCSDVKVPGSTPLTSRPKLANLDASAEAGRVRGVSSMVIRVRYYVPQATVFKTLYQSIPFMTMTPKLVDDYWLISCLLQKKKIIFFPTSHGDFSFGSLYPAILSTALREMRNHRIRGSDILRPRMEKTSASEPSIPPFSLCLGVAAPCPAWCWILWDGWLLVYLLFLMCKGVFSAWGVSGHNSVGYSQQATTQVAVACMFFTCTCSCVCSTKPSCSLMGPRWLIYPILSYPLLRYVRCGTTVSGGATKLCFSSWLALSSNKVLGLDFWILLLRK